MNYTLENFVHCKTALNIDIYNDKIYASVNPYIGCEHQCRYCYVQAEKYSKQNDLSVVKIKHNIIDVLIKDLAKYNTRFPTGTIYLGTSSDPYQPQERIYRLSHKILSLVLNHTAYNIHIFTKSIFILDDIDLFKKFANRINISISIITVDENIKKIFEPNSHSVNQRLQCMLKLNSEGINCGCAIMPVLPYITDSIYQLESLYSQLKQHNCKYVWWGYLTLRRNITNIKKLSQKEIYYRILYEYYPELVKKYDELYNNKFLPNNGYQKMIDLRLKNLAKKYKIPYYGPIWRNSAKPIQLFLNL